MLVLRDCFQGVRRFDAFQKRLGVTRHVLADRLRKLESAGVLERKQYQDRPPRFEYRLTEKGLALHPVLITLIKWTETWDPLDEGESQHLRDRETGERLDPVLVDAGSGRPLTHRSFRRPQPSRPAD